MGLIAKFKEHKARRKTAKEVLEGYHYTRPMPPVKPPKKSVEGETEQQPEFLRKTFHIPTDQAEGLKVTEKDIELIEGFINKKEPQVLEFNEAQAVFKMLYEIYRRCT